MQLVTNADWPTTSTGGQRFLINLQSYAPGNVEVRSCEVIGPQFRNRFTFASKVAVEDVFVEAVRAGIERCLSSLSDTTEVVSLPSVVIEIPGMTLAKAHLIASKNEDGVLTMILRFKLMLGSVNYAFHPKLGIESSIPDHSSHTSASVLADIVMPLLDLCNAAEFGGLKSTAEFDRFLETLSDRADEVRFQSELIKRFVVTAANTPRERPRRVNGRPTAELVRTDGSSYP